MKKPIPEDFGMTTEEYEKAAKERVRLMEMPPRQGFSEWTRFKVFFLSIGLAVVVGTGGGWLLTEGLGVEEGWGFLVGFVSFWVIFVKWWYRLESRERRRRLKELSKPIYKKVQLYEEALSRYQHTSERYWMSLKGERFEKQLARLYKRLGYSVERTQTSVDKGIDLILWKDDKKIVAQCKGHKKPIGVSAIRDLYGTMMHSEAASGVLACPAGFTKGVREFAMGKPIELISASDLVEMAEGVGKANT